MKYNLIYVFSILSSIFLISIKSTEYSYSLFDIDLDNINDDVLSKFKDFDFAKEKQDIILIKEKMKKVACLNIISAIIKEAETDIKLKLKKAKDEYKNNFNKFINNMTDICINIIKEQDIKKILNHENFQDKNFPLDEESLKFEENLDKFLQENERIKTLEKIENEKKIRNKRILYSIVIGVIGILIFIIGRKIKKKKGEKNDNKDDKNQKKTGHNKKKSKKIE